jgi:hypothetical protein
MRFTLAGMFCAVAVCAVVFRISRIEPPQHPGAWGVQNGLVSSIAWNQERTLFQVRDYDQEGRVCMGPQAYAEYQAFRSNASDAVAIVDGVFVANPGFRWPPAWSGYDPCSWWLRDREPWETFGAEEPTP